MSTANIAQELKDYLQTIDAKWVVTRDLSLFENQKGDVAGRPVLSLVVGAGTAQGRGSLGNAPTDDLVFLLLAQQNLANQNASGAQIEAIELTIKEQVRQALAAPNVPPDISGAFIKNWTTSGQQNTERAEVLMTISVREY